LGIIQQMERCVGHSLVLWHMVNAEVLLTPTEPGQGSLAPLNFGKSSL
jgi:hypothetical protein